MATAAIRPFVLRPIESADADALRRFHARLSDESVYRRYHGPHRALRDREVGFFVSADGRRHVAEVACRADGEIVGMCRVIAGPERIHGEVAIVVADDSQGRGIGHALLARVLRAAAEAGIRIVDAAILAENHRAQRLFARTADELGVGVRRSWDGAVVNLRMDLTPLA